MRRKGQLEMAKYDRGTAREIGRQMRDYQENDREEKGKPRHRLARNRRQAIAMALAGVRAERLSATGRGPAGS